MNLEELNPKVYEMWRSQKELGSDFFQESKEEEIKAIEDEIGESLPEDYKDFLRKYSTVLGSMDVGAYYFKVDYKEKSFIAYLFTLVPWANLTLLAARTLRRQHIVDSKIGARVPDGLVPLTMDNQTTVLIDVRPETYGKVWYIDKIKRQTFGTPGYSWENIGFVANSFTEFLAGLDTEKNLVAKYGLPVK
ncbi:SMI1/KNR4 family protein [Sinorhizobium americanum]|uniref:SMI1/KNR4 family protein SUKH-1 n=1 Tax=Sinorhizobium americanum TaxID=194963 RepID=A0A4R2C5D0_9HYPH|nr:SMI1/KNR4 family protein [Sinorhizobium americanum]TCN33794.1 SMI1/KNR4 family protein SUKH-1 [Sinorhizobium americanum]